MLLRCNLTMLLLLATLSGSVMLSYAQGSPGNGEFSPPEMRFSNSENDDGAEMPPPRPYRRRQAQGDEPEFSPQPGQFPGQPASGAFRRRRFQQPPGGNFDQDMPDGRQFGGRPGGQRGPAGQRQGMGGQMNAVPLDLTQLNLTQQQKDKIKQQREVNSSKAREIRQNLRQARMQMRNLMFDPQATDAQILSQRQQLKSMQNKLDDLLVNDFLSLRSVLSPEQKKKLPELAPGKQNQGARARSGLPRFPDQAGFPGPGQSNHRMAPSDIQ